MKKQNIFFVKLLLVITVVSLSAYSIACGESNKDSSENDKITGPVYTYGVSFETNEEFLTFYNEYKKQNSKKTLMFGLEDNERFKDLKYKFECSAFNHAQITPDNKYNYKFDNSYFVYTISYITDTDIEKKDPPTTEKECVDIEFFTTGLENSELTLAEIIYTQTEDAQKYISYCTVFNYSASFNDEEIFNIKIKFKNGSKNNTAEYANGILDTLKQNAVILK